MHPKGGDMFSVKGQNCVVKRAHLGLNTKTRTTFFDIVAETEDGSLVRGLVDADRIIHTGWGWADTKSPYDLACRCELGVFHVVVVDSQEEHTVVALNPSAAASTVKVQQDLHNQELMVHPILVYTLKPSILRMFAGIHRELRLGGIGEGALGDCFGYPGAASCATDIFKQGLADKLRRIDASVQERIEEEIGLIEWPCLERGILFCTDCIKETQACECDEQ